MISDFKMFSRVLFPLFILVFLSALQFLELALLPPCLPVPNAQCPLTVQNCA